MTRQIADHARFIVEQTSVLPVPLVPEILLHLAHEAIPIWKKTEEELGELGLPPPFWAFAWAGGQALSRYVLDNPEAVAGKTVLDLATGAGLVAIAAHMAGARDVLAADIDAFALAATGLNAQLNAASIKVTAEDLLQQEPPRRDVILVGDVFYERPLADIALVWLQKARDAGAEILIGDPGRSYLPRHALVKLHRYGVPACRELEDAEIKQTAVWALA